MDTITPLQRLGRFTFLLFLLLGIYSIGRLLQTRDLTLVISGSSAEASFYTIDMVKSMLLVILIQLPLLLWGCIGIIQLKRREARIFTWASIIFILTCYPTMYHILVTTTLKSTFQVITLILLSFILIVLVLINILLRRQKYRSVLTM